MKTKFKWVNHEQNTQGWEEWRKSVLSASVAPAVVQVNPFEPKTPYQLWEMETGKRKRFYNKAMADGHHLEDKARDTFNEIVGANFQPKCAERRFENGLNFAASFDGVDGDFIAEIKCVSGNSPTWKKAKDNDAGHYLYQVAHQARVLSAKGAYFVVYNKDTEDMRYFEIPINDLKKAWTEVYDAWLKYTTDIKENGHPEMTVSDTRTRDDEEWHKVATQYREVKQACDEAAAKVRELKAQLEELAGGVNSAGSNVTITFSERRGSIDYGKACKELLPEVDFEPYRKAGSSVSRVTVAKAVDDEFSAI